MGHGKLTNLDESRITLETMILTKNNGKTAFLMWISSYCLACFYQNSTKAQQMFSLFTYHEEGNSPAIKHTKNISGVNKLVEAIINVIQNQQHCESIEYDILYMSC